MTTTPKTTATDDIRDIEKKAIGEIRQEWRQALKELEEVIQEVTKLSDLLKQFNKESDRLTERMSTQLKAHALIMEEAKNRV